MNKKKESTRKLTIVFKESDYFEKIFQLVENQKSNFPTTSFNRKKLSMVIEKGRLPACDAIAIGCLEVSDVSKTGITIDTAKVCSLNRKSHMKFESYVF